MTQFQNILIVGNPNVGKSAIFSRLTGAPLITANYPGTTVEYKRGHVTVEGRDIEMLDSPGIYSLKPTSEAEKVAVELINKADLIINVVDATNLERNLSLTLELLEKDKHVIIALNMWDETKHKGVEIDILRLKDILGVPVIPTCGITAMGIKDLVLSIKESKKVKSPQLLDEDRWKAVGEIIENTQKLRHRHHTFLENLEDLSIKPLSAIPIALLVIAGSFLSIRYIAEGIINNITEPFFQSYLTPILIKFSNAISGNPFIQNILVGSSPANKIDFMQSFGILTTGLYLPIGVILPYIISFYLILGLLEDFGYLPRLAILSDVIMHKLGLHGYGIVPLVLGLGCNVPGVMALRLMEDRRQKFIAATLMAGGVPCIPQIAMIISVVGPKGLRYVGIIFLTLFILMIIKGFILNKIMKGESHEILLEMSPYRLPHAGMVFKKLWMRVSGFLREAVPYILLGVLIVNLLYKLGFIEALMGLFRAPLEKILGLPKEAIASLTIGFLRKDVGVSMLLPFDLTAKQLVIGSVLLATYFPCLATSAVLIKEIGLKDTLKATTVMLFTALATAAVLNLILNIL